MQKELKRVHVLQAGMFLGMFHAALGLLFGLIYGGVLLLVGAAGAAGGMSSTSGGPGGPECWQ